MDFILPPASSLRRQCGNVEHWAPKVSDSIELHLLFAHRVFHGPVRIKARVSNGVFLHNRLRACTFCFGDSRLYLSALLEHSTHPMIQPLMAACENLRVGSQERAEETYDMADQLRLPSLVVAQVGPSCMFALYRRKRKAFCL